MKNIFKMHNINMILTGTLMFCSVFSTTAQQVKTSYFMKSSNVRTHLNPAFQPERGYVSIPVLGGIQADFSTNGVVLDNFIYPVNGKTVTFMDNAVDTEAFLKNLKENNQLNMNAYTTILSAGWYKGQGFWTVDLSLKGQANASVPKSMFEFMKRGNSESGSVYNISDIQLRSDAYMEAALGYSRPINEKLTLGAKAKVLLGIGSMETNIDQLRAELSADKWTITSSGSLSVAMKGLEPEFKRDEESTDRPEYISGFDFDSPGISGFGLGVDLGANYQLTENISLSASILDLGFISWSKSAITTASTTNESFVFDGFELPLGDHTTGKSVDEQFNQIQDDLEDLFRFSETTSEGRSSRLRTSVLLGGEYRLLENKLGFGLVSSTYFYQPKIMTEITVSANYRPIDWFEATLSYSVLHSDLKTYGLALNFSPSWINFFIGSDYMPTKVNPQFIPVSGPAASLYCGISIPLKN